MAPTARRSLTILLTAAAVAAAVTLPIGGAMTAAADSASVSVRGAAAPAGPVVAIPAPGSVTAAPQTDIVLRGTSTRPVSITGSRSGVHAGSVSSHPDGKGLTVHQDRPFVAGEIVTVITAVPVAGATGTSYTFRVGRPAKHPDMLPDGEIAPPVTSPQGRKLAAADAAAEKADKAAAEAAAAGEQSADAAAAVAPSYVSRPDLRPPTVTVQQSSGSQAPGLLMATPAKSAKNQGGSMIYDDAGRLVWFREEAAGRTAGNLTTTSYHGQPALTWFEGTAPYGAGSYRGEWVVVDNSYTEVARIRMGNGYQADLHDIAFTDHGSAYLIGYNPLLCDGVTLKGCAIGATVLEGVLQEVDIDTGLVLFEWHSLDAGHIPLADSYGSPGGPLFDYLHANSLDVDLDGNLLMSARHTSSLYKINAVTGDFMFILGGKRNQFSYVNEGHTPPVFQGPDYPHDFGVRPDGSYTYFDNGVMRQLAGQEESSRGAVVRLDLTAKTATYLKAIHHSPALYGPTQGRMQTLPGDHQLIAWGGLGIVTEYDQTNARIFEASMAAGTYRQNRGVWTGAPAAPPTLAMVSAAAPTRAAVSWNGDTRTTSWRMLAGSTPQTLAAVGTAPRSGFETSLTFSGTGPYYAVEALDAGGAVLARSAVQQAGSWFTERASYGISGSYRPFVGDFGGSRNDDVFYYGPGATREYLHVSGADGRFSSVAMPGVAGDYTPLIGDFVGDDRDEILWWSPTRAVGYLWRFDRNSRDTLAITPQQAVVPVLAGNATRPVVLHHRATYGGSKAEILWYGVGSAPDRFDRYVWTAGRPAQVISRATAINGSYRPSTGDFNGDGMADVLWYATGSGADSIWLVTGTTTGSTGQRSLPVAISGNYQPVVGNFVGTAERQEILFWQSGSAPDSVWSFAADGSHTSIGATSSLSGRATLLRGPQDHVAVWAGNSSPAIGGLANGRFGYQPSQNTAMPSNYWLLAGDFAGAGGLDSILWYAPGASPERLYVPR